HPTRRSSDLLTLTAKMEDSIAKLKHFSKLDFQSKREVINNGRPMPELKVMLQTTGQKITRSTSHIQRQIQILKHFSKLDFQSKREVINNGRPMPELKVMLQTTGQKITRSTSHIQSQIALKMFGTSRIHLVLDLCNFVR